MRAIKQSYCRVQEQIPLNVITQMFIVKNRQKRCHGKLLYYISLLKQ